MFRYSLLLFMLSSSIIFISCNSENSASDESEKAYQDYKNFVTQVESDTVVDEIDLGNTWKIDTDTLQMLYDRYKNSASEHTGNYTPERLEEVNAFDDRVNVAFEKRQKKYEDVSHRYELRKKMLGMEVSEDDMSEITATNIAATYTNFVTTLENNQEEYDMQDWQLIEGWWIALQNRRRAVDNDLQASDQQTINKLQETYQRIRSEALTENT